MDRCHQSTHNWQHIFKHKRRVALRRDNVQIESGCKAVITERGASASQIAAAKFIGIIPRLRGTTGAANGAVSAYTHECVGCLPECNSLRQRNAIQFRYCSFVIVIQLTGDKKNKDPVGALKMQLDGRPLAGFSWERTREDVLTQHLEKSEQLGCLYFYRKAKLFLPVDVDDINMVACKER